MIKYRKNENWDSMEIEVFNIGAVKENSVKVLHKLYKDVDIVDVTFIEKHPINQRYIFLILFAHGGKI